MDNKIKEKWQLLDKKVDKWKKYKLYGRVSFVIIIILYIILIILAQPSTLLSGDYRLPVIVFLVLSLIAFVYFNSQKKKNDPLPSEKLFYYFYKLAHDIEMEELKEAKSDIIWIVLYLGSLKEDITDTLYSNKIIGKLDELIEILKDYIYPTITKQNDNGIYCINLKDEENLKKYEAIQNILSNSAQNFLSETFLESKYDYKDKLYHENIDIHNFKEYSFVFSVYNEFKKYYISNLPFKFAVNFIIILLIVYLFSLKYEIGSLNNILTLTAIISAAITRIK